LTFLLHGADAKKYSGFLSFFYLAVFHQFILGYHVFYFRDDFYWEYSSPFSGKRYVLKDEYSLLDKTFNCGGGFLYYVNNSISLSFDVNLELWKFYKLFDKYNYKSFSPRLGLYFDF